MERLIKRIKVTHITPCTKRKRDEKQQNVSKHKKQARNRMLPPTRHVHPLIRACVFGNIDAVETILENDSKAVNVTECTGRTALVFAIIMGKHRIVCRLLEEGGINVNTVDKDGKTPMHYANYFIDSQYSRTEERLLILAALKGYIKNGNKSFFIL
jgi:ankyrin repeat protein